MGIMQNMGASVLGSAAAPLILVPVATAFGWRNAFYLAAIPGLISAFVIWMLVKEPIVRPRHVAEQRLTFTDALSERNIALCSLMAMLLISYVVICWSFLPLYLTSSGRYSLDEMTWLMAALGISAGLSSFVVPAISDRVGRKPVMIIVPLMGVLLPIAALGLEGSAWTLGAVFFLSWAFNGTFPLMMATIPSETVDPKHVATALGFVMGTGEILGGVLAPTVAGGLADVYGLAAPLWMMAGLSLLASAVAFGLRETAPVKSARN